MKNEPREKSIGAHMSVALQLMKRKNHQAIVKAGSKITMEQLVVLEMLATHGDMNMSELSIKVWKQNANITRIVDKLENNDWVERKAVVGDRRANLVCITTDGKKLYEKVIPEVFKIHEEVTSCITNEEQEITLRTLKKIIDHLSE